MIIQSKYTKVFHSNDLTRTKYDELIEFAIALRNHKNKVSKFVNDNLLKYLSVGSLQFVTDMRSSFPNSIPSSFDKQLYVQVLTCYKNKFDAIQRNLSFSVIVFNGFEFYKRKTKNHEKGDFKKVKTGKKQTELSICLTYLARYGNENILDYIGSQLESADEKKKKFYQSIICCCEKFGLERLLRLALSKRNRIIGHYSEKPIEFKSLTFGGRSRKKLIIEYNKTFGSKINAFISLSGLGRSSFDIPVSYCKDWHGAMGDYKKSHSDYEYLISFNERTHQVRIYICKDGERFIPDVDGNSKLVGADVNCKHNLLSLSNGDTYDFDRKLLNGFCKLSTEIDKLKKESKDYKVGKRKQWKLDKLREKMLKLIQQTISDMCKKLREEGYTHIVMENLDNGFGRSFVKDKSNEDINFNRIVKFLHLSSLKDEVEHIGRKYGIAVSIVQSCYTSKMCPICGCIEGENRPTQEEFCCIECGYRCNADYNAAVNIRNRVAEAVLRKHLLKQRDNGTYEPKKLKKEKDKVKEELLLYRSNLQRGREVVSNW